MPISPQFQQMPKPDNKFLRLLSDLVMPSNPVEGALDLVAPLSTIGRTSTKIIPKIAKLAEEVTGSAYGQTDVLKRAIGTDGNELGKLSYSIFEGKPHIQHIEVPEAYRRNGIATQLIESLSDEFGGMANIKTGMRTDDGAKFFDWIEKKHGFDRLKPLKDKQAELGAVEAELSKIGEIYEGVRIDIKKAPTETEANALREKFQKMGNRWNDLADKKRIIEDELYEIQRDLY